MTSMNNEGTSIFMEGYLLLPTQGVPEYRGVDRDPFEPAIVHEEIDESLAFQHKDSDLIWEMYAPGWRRDAYRLFEENMVQGQGDLSDLELIYTSDIAFAIQDIIQPYMGEYEVVACKVWKEGIQLSEHVLHEPPSLGYDIAYPGGDYFSAIRDGLSLHPRLHSEPSLELINAYGSLLNSFGLFSHVDPIMPYLTDFRKITPYEVKRTYCVYWLSLLPG